MALKITDECINCGVCEPECPNQAIFMGQEQYQIRPGRCTECVGAHPEPRCISLCPISDCVIINPDRVESKEELERKAKRIVLNRALDRMLEKNSNLL